MVTRPLKYKGIVELIRENRSIIQPILANDEAAPHISLAKEIKNGRDLTIPEFVKWVAWKSSRRLDLIKDNKKEVINRAIRNALEATELEDKVKILTEGRYKLKGVGIPVASAILMFFDPVNFGVIDIRAHRVLCKYGEVTPGNCGRSFSPPEYAYYIKLIRSYRSELAKQGIYLKAREIDLVLWAYDGEVRKKDGVY